MNEEWKAKTAFTLIELLVVVAILGVLLGLLLPTLSNAKSKSNSTLCKNHLRQLGFALQMYVHDHESKFPYCVSPYDPSLDDDIGTANTRYWWAKLLPYYPTKWTDPTYHCPGYKGAITGELHPRPPFGSYAYNAFGVSGSVGAESARHGIHYHPDTRFGFGPPTYRSNPRPAIPEAEMQIPSEMFAIGESRFLGAGLNGYPGGVCEMACGWLNWPDGSEPNRINAYSAPRHGKSYSQYFWDGHVAAMSPWVLFNPTNSASMWNSDHQPHPELWSR